MDADENAFGELIQDYIVECLPLAEQVGDAFIELERRWRAGDAGDDLLVPLKGQLHTVKGNSAMMGLTPMQDVAHALEDVCVLLATQPALRGDEVAALLVAGSGLLIDLIRSAAQGSDPKPAAQFVKRVRSLLARSRTGKGSKSPALFLERRREERRNPEVRAETADSSSSVVRVDFRRLDALLEVLGEGMIEQESVAELYRRLVRKVGMIDELADLDRALVALRKTLKRMEGILMETRLLPISTVFGRFPRLVRDLAESEKKRVRVIATGGDLPLDKAILDRLGEPLIHLLTNAVVHGIESPQERVSAGKPEEATLELRATSESGRVVIRLTDDGRGLDDTKILAKAKDLGLEARASDPQQLRSLIFLPGFTTAEQVSSLAGRGVGLDVVASSVHQLGGTIEVESRPGRGVTFTLSLPLTMAVLRSLIVEVDRERYAVPISHIAATVRTEPDTIHQMNRRNVALWRGNLIDLSDGGALLGTAAGANTSRRFYIVLSMGNRKRGILVDRLVGHQDVVVKGLDPTVGRPEVVSGTTILGDGSVACILDAVRILDQRVPA
jgi:two-component system, chemotaxis family, sensor kinase CheA